MSNKPDNLELIASDSRGIYCPQHVAESCTLEPIHNGESMPAYLAECVANLRKGPDCETYWDDWAWVLDNACVRVGRARWALYQDGDVWAYRMNASGRRELAKLTGE